MRQLPFYCMLVGNGKCLVGAKHESKTLYFGMDIELLMVGSRIGARRTYGFRDLISIFAPDFGFNWENGGFWII